MDTGATVSLLPESLVREKNFTCKPVKSSIKLTVANGDQVVIKNKIDLDINLGFGTIRWHFLVGLIRLPIIGHDLMSSYNILVRPKTRSIY